MITLKALEKGIPQETTLNVNFPNIDKGEIKGIKICRRTPELIDNISIDKIWENFSPELIKTRSTFTKKLSKS